MLVPKKSINRTIKVLNSRMNQSIERINGGVPFETVLLDELGHNMIRLPKVQREELRAQAHESMEKVLEECQNEKRRAVEGFESLAVKDQVIAILEAVDKISSFKESGLLFRRFSDADKDLLETLSSASVRFKGRRYVAEDLLKDTRIEEGSLPRIYAEIKAYNRVSGCASDLLHGKRMEKNSEKVVLANAIFENLRETKKLPPVFHNMGAQDRSDMICYGIETGFIECEEGTDNDTCIADYTDSLAGWISVFALTAVLSRVVPNPIIATSMEAGACIAVLMFLKKLMEFLSKKYPLGLMECRSVRRVSRFVCNKLKKDWK